MTGFDFGFRAKSNPALHLRARNPRQKNGISLITSKNAEYHSKAFRAFHDTPHGRSVGIRTRGLLVPNQARYQTSPHPDSTSIIRTCARFVKRKNDFFQTSFSCVRRIACFGGEALEKTVALRAFRCACDCGAADFSADGGVVPRVGLRRLGRTGRGGAGVLLPNFDAGKIRSARRGGVL